MGSSATAPLEPEERQRLREDLQALSEAAGVSGAEGEVRRLIAQRAAPLADRLETDVMGNLVAWRYPEGASGPDGTPVVMLAAHMDEVGLLVSHIEGDGTLRFRKVGGIDDRVLMGQHVRIGPRSIPGVIGVKPFHLQKPDERGRAEEASQLVIDIGADSREQAEKAVELGDFAVFATRFQMLGERRALGKAFDDRVGCAVLLQILARRYPVSVAAVFTVQEEVGTRGAEVAAYHVGPDLALVLEGTTCADIAGSEPHAEATRLGEGPALSVMDATSIASPALVRLLVRTAEQERIPYQWRRVTAGGNDAGPIHTSRFGVPCATVSVPCRYIHGPAAICDLRDAEGAVRLVRGFLAQLGQTGLADGRRPAGGSRQGNGGDAT